jgi:hypothetical protein
MSNRGGTSGRTSSPGVPRTAPASRTNSDNRVSRWTLSESRSALRPFAIPAVRLVYGLTCTDCTRPRPAEIRGSTPCKAILAINGLRTVPVRTVRTACLCKTGDPRRPRPAEIRGSTGKAGAIQPVEVRPKFGSECCVVNGDVGCEAYTAIAWGMGLNHERSDIAGAEHFHSLEGNMCGTAMR